MPASGQLINKVIPVAVTPAAGGHGHANHHPTEVATGGQGHANHQTEVAAGEHGHLNHQMEVAALVPG